MSRNARHHLPPGSNYAEGSPRQLTKQKFGRRLMDMMLKKGWNQSDLARNAQLGRDAISTYVRGRSFPEPRNLDRLAAALGVAKTDLLPNTAAAAIDNDPAPMLEIKQAAGHPDMVWVRVNRMVSFDQAVRIFEVLKENLGNAKIQ